ncbi:MAG: hypothetical protein QG653_261 [Patescibacteria group bacterium]|nr:hypothetical protein [Patescibacteria group bacterium]
MKKQIAIYKTMTFRERIVNSMLVTMAVLMVLYCLILLSIVFSVIERKQAISQTKDLISTLSSIEGSYANEISKINDSVLSAKEYVRLDATTLTVRKDPIAGYTVLYER